MDKDKILAVKWAARLGRALQDTPAGKMAADAKDPAKFHRSLLGRARPGTAKKRVRDWELFSRWLTWAKGHAWPEEVGDLIGHLASRVSEGCLASFPVEFKSAVVWMEARAGYPTSQNLGGHEIFKKFIDRAAVEVERITLYRLWHVARRHVGWA